MKVKRQVFKTSYRFRFMPTIDYLIYVKGVVLSWGFWEVGFYKKEECKDCISMLQQTGMCYCDSIKSQMRK
jgi:hypothetical protein